MPKAFLLKRRSHNGPNVKEQRMKEVENEATVKCTLREEVHEDCEDIFVRIPKARYRTETDVQFHPPPSAFTKYQSELSNQQHFRNVFQDVRFFYPFEYSRAAFLESSYQDRKFLPFSLFHSEQKNLPSPLVKYDIPEVKADAELQLAETREELLAARHGITDFKHPLRCEQCGKIFKTKYTLAIHLKMPSHTGARPFVCGVCGKGFRLSSTLCRHKIIHTTDRPHKCHICDKAFNRSSTLKTHIRTHSDVKEYMCEVCEKGFHQKGNLRNHALIHTGEKPYKCRLCEKAFNKLSNLKFHMHVHTDNSPYRCRFCKVSFSRRCDLKSHIANVHEKAKRN